MERFPYRDQDRAFGQIMLTVRDALGLTQVALAVHLGVSRRAVGDWETGNKYPKAEHLKEFIALAVRRGAFTTGSELDEIRAIWRAAHQRELLDEKWLTSILRQRPPAATLAGQRENALGNSTVAPLVGEPDALPPTSTPTPRPEGARPRVDWGSAPSAPHFYGRGWELGVLTEWVVEERCRVVSVLGLGGVGKSALAVSLMHRIAEQFEVVIWRSLRDIPSCDTLIRDLLQALTLPGTGMSEMNTGPPPGRRSQEGARPGLEQNLSGLLERLRQMRVLLVLDNLESVLARSSEGSDATGHIDHTGHAGRMRPGYEAFGRILQRVAETEHRSCMLLTSREKPVELVAQEGSHSPVRVLRLARLDGDSCVALLTEKGVKGTADEQARLIEAYAGNPLALIIVSQTIVDLFDGDPSLFLEQGETIYGGVRQLLSEQVKRLSELEHCLLTWLAIMGEPTTFDKLRSMLVTPVPPGDMLDALEGLHHRNLIEGGQQPGSLTLKPAILEYVTSVLLSEASDEIRNGRLDRLIKYGLELAHAKDYERETQETLLVAQLLARLQAMPQGRSNLEVKLIALLDQMRNIPEDAQGYGPANLLALLRLLRGDLRGLELAGLVLRGAYL